VADEAGQEGDGEIHRIVSLQKPIGGSQPGGSEALYIYLSTVEL